MTWSRQGSDMGAGWASARSRVLRASDGICYLCGREGADEVDHVVPRSRGGSNDPENLRPVHKSCHSRKSAAEGHAVLKRKRELRKRPRDKHPGRFDE